MVNTSGIKPCGHSILVLPDEVEEKSEGGIILHTAAMQGREEMGQTEGVVVDIGCNAWKDQLGGQPWANIGDRIIFAKYAGTMCDGVDEKKYRLLSDLDCKAIKEYKK